MRQSTPRRRLQEAQLADKIYNVGSTSGSSREEKKVDEGELERTINSIFIAANQVAKSSVLAALRNFEDDGEEKSSQ